METQILANALSFHFYTEEIQKTAQRLAATAPVRACDFDFDYKVIVTNKTESAKSVVLFHNGSGSQEAIFGHAKNDAALDVLPSKRLAGNQLFTQPRAHLGGIS